MISFYIVFFPDPLCRAIEARISRALALLLQRTKQLLNQFNKIEPSI
jgi:hypothetical protein